jgi:hypothetical protein
MKGEYFIGELERYLGTSIFKKNGIGRAYSMYVGRRNACEALFRSPQGNSGA